MNVAILGAGSIATCMATAINGLDDSVEAYAVAAETLTGRRHLLISGALRRLMVHMKIC